MLWALPKPVRIDPRNRVATDIGIEIDASAKPQWVFGDESADDWIVVSGAVVGMELLRQRSLLLVRRSLSEETSR
jgi:hypothetical protein